MAPFLGASPPPSAAPTRSAEAHRAQTPAAFAKCDGTDPRPHWLLEIIEEQIDTLRCSPEEAARALADCVGCALEIGS